MIKTVSNNIATVIMNYKNIRTNNTGVCMWVHFNWYSTMITPTTSRFDCANWHGISLVSGHRTAVPLGPPSPSRFLFLNVLGQVGILLVCCHLAVFKFFFGWWIKTGNIYPWCNKSHNHLLVQSSETVNLTVVQLNSRCKASCLFWWSLAFLWS